MDKFKTYLEAGLGTTLAGRTHSAARHAAGVAGNVAIDLAADAIPGGGVVKAAIEGIGKWLGERGKREQIGSIREAENQLRQANIDPEPVFHIEKPFADLLSDAALEAIAKKALAEVNKLAPDFRGLSNCLIEKEAYKILAAHLAPIKEKYSQEVQQRKQQAQQSQQGQQGQGDANWWQGQGQQGQQGQPQQDNKGTWWVQQNGQWLFYNNDLQQWYNGNGPGTIPLTPIQ